ncbi:MAG: methanethiol S-methyltransferase [Pseudomonadota bacterium]
MKRPRLIAYGLLTYLLFNASFIYLIGFLQSFGVPKAINDGNHVSPTFALSITVSLVFLFGFFHSLMARDWFKRRWTKLIGQEAERSTYVLQSALFLLLAMWQWQPMPAVIWHLTGAAAVAVIALFAVGVATLLTATFLIDHFELFGLKQVWYASRKRSLPSSEFKTPVLYRWVRHPMQLGVIITVFAVPHMTLGHLCFALCMTLYVLIGLHFEERALVREFGDRYREYQQRVPMLIPGIRLVTRRSASLPTRVSGGAR